MQAKHAQGVQRKIPQFDHIRRTLAQNYSPPVHMEIAYKNKETDQVTIVKDTITPKSRFPPHRFEKMFEIATVKVNIHLMPDGLSKILICLHFYIARPTI